MNSENILTLFNQIDVHVQITENVEASESNILADLPDYYEEFNHEIFDAFSRMGYITVGISWAKDGSVVTFSCKSNPMTYVEQMGRWPNINVYTEFINWMKEQKIIPLDRINIYFDGQVKLN